MATSPAQPVSINLLEHSETEDSVVNRLTNWAITYGRYIMIGTEIVVLLAFISRFSLDRRLTDLREEINQKEIILVANQDFELEFRNIQQKIETVKTLVSTQTNEGDILFLLQSILPSDVFLTEFQLAKNQLDFQAVSGTTESFSRFLSLLSQEKHWNNIEITNIQKNTLNGIEFHISASVVPTKPTNTL